MDKILIIRFSSIGDIVLTTPVIRALYKLPERPEIHFITKRKYASTLQHNPYINKLYTFEKEITELVSDLKSENYTYIIDLHSNLRSKRLKLLLGNRSKSFHKLNIKKWVRVKLKYDLLPKKHIVQRYMDTVGFLGAKNDDLGLDYFVTEQDQNTAASFMTKFPEGYHVFVIGGTHFTKQIPSEMLINIAKSSRLPIILIGGPEDYEKGVFIQDSVGKSLVNTCGKYNLNESAAIIKACQKVLTSDTGMMHIASAFRKEIISLWGNTIPEFGMYPYFPKADASKNKIFEVKNLKCRPCSKIGYKECPKKHFNCMLHIDIQQVIHTLNS